MVLTAIRADKGKVVNHINKLENYNVGEIAKIAIDHGLYEEAFSIYKKYDQHALRDECPCGACCEYRSWSGLCGENQQARSLEPTCKGAAGWHEN